MIITEDQIQENFQFDASQIANQNETNQFEVSQFAPENETYQGSPVINYVI